MKWPMVLVTVLAAVTLQAALARYTVAGTWVFDLVLVGVVFAALRGGPVAGIWAGTTGGLLQDLLAGGIVGVGGLAKTLIGAAAGLVGAQFVLVSTRASVAVLAGSTVVHRLLTIALAALVAQQWPALSWGAILAETGLNALAGFLVFQGAEAFPGLVERGRLRRRSSLGRRRW